MENHFVCNYMYIIWFWVMYNININILNKISEVNWEYRVNHIYDMFAYFRISFRVRISSVLIWISNLFLTQNLFKYFAILVWILVRVYIWILGKMLSLAFSMHHRFNRYVCIDMFWHQLDSTFFLFKVDDKFWYLKSDYRYIDTDKDHTVHSSTMVQETNFSGFDHLFRTLLSINLITSYFVVLSFSFSILFIYI